MLLVIKNAYKGELFYEAEFVPAVPLRDIGFGERGGNKQLVGVQEKTFMDHLNDEIGRDDGENPGNGGRADEELQGPKADGMGMPRQGGEAITSEHGIYPTEQVC